MQSFDYPPSSSSIEHEEAVGRYTMFGEGYRQFNGPLLLGRIWALGYYDLPDDDLNQLHSFLAPHRKVLWVQPEPYSQDGQQVTTIEEVIPQYGGRGGIFLTSLLVKLSLVVSDGRSTQRAGELERERVASPESRLKPFRFVTR